MNESDDVVEIAFLGQRLRHHRHLASRRILRISSAYAVAEVLELPLEIRCIETGEPRCLQGLIAFGRAAMTGAALAVVEIGAVADVALRRLCDDRFRL